METAKLTATTRTDRGSAAARRMRRAGKLPANLTGLGQEPLALQVSEHDFAAAHHRGARLVDLAIGEEQVQALVREIQWDTFGDRVLHVDFDRIDADRRIEVEVPFDFYGEPAGASEGGVFQVLMNQVNVECLPVAIPDSIEIDVRAMKVGEEIRIRDVRFPEGVIPVDADPEEIVAILSEAEEEEETEAGVLEGEGAAEPVVLTRKDKAEEED